MAFPTETFLQHIRNAAAASGQWVSQELEHLYASIEGYLRVDHKDDGTHADVTADSVTTIKDDDTGATGAIDAGGPISWLGGNAGSITAPTGYSVYSGYGIEFDVEATKRSWAIASGRDGLAPCVTFIDQTTGYPVMALYHISGTTYQLSRATAGVGTTLNLGGVGTSRLGAVVSTTVTTSGDITAGADLVATDQLFERGRSVAVGEWQSFNTTWTAASGTPDVGTGGSISGRYTLIGKTCRGYVNLVAGTSGFDPGSGVWTFTLPVTSSGVGNSVTMGGNTLFRDNDAATYYVGGVTRLISTTQFRALTVGGNDVGSASPFTAAASDQWRFEFTYEIA